MQKNTSSLRDFEYEFFVIKPSRAKTLSRILEMIPEVDGLRTKFYEYARISKALVPLNYATELDKEDGIIEKEIQNFLSEAGGCGAFNEEEMVFLEGVIRKVFVRSSVKIKGTFGNMFTKKKKKKKEETMKEESESGSED